MKNDSPITLENRRVFVIAEIGINHNGDFEKAKELVDCAVGARADCAKFQVRDLKSLYVAHGNADNAELDLGAQYTLDLLNRFQLSTDEYFELFDYCRKRNITPLCTPWDEKSVDLLEQYGFDTYKVASADMTNDVLLERLFQTGARLIISTGMAEESEIDSLITLLTSRSVDFALLHCNSTYPAPFHGINLRYMTRLAKKVPNGAVGYSGHERGYEVPVAAVAMGARIIEKHITLDKGMEGNDHRVSLLPTEFAEMVQSIRNVEAALGSDSHRVLSVGERMNRENLAKSLIAAVVIERGQIITREMIDVKSPGDGLQPNKISELIGQKARRTLKKDDRFYASDVGSIESIQTTFEFSRKFGVPVRFHDCDLLIGKSNVDFVEFHLSYKDVDGFPDNCNIQKRDIPFTVHTPDLFAGDHLVDFASLDHEYRERSIHEIQRVIDLTRNGLSRYFRVTEPIKIVASLGGFTRTGFLDEHQRAELYERVSDSIDKLDTLDVEILPQTLPPFPWYLGGQLFCNLFMGAEDTVDFCLKRSMRLCFDVSHSKLACNYLGHDFTEFVATVAPVTGHLHIVDAASIDSEGLQIGDGEICFQTLFQQLESLGVDAWFIPEIWQGHKDSGAGFWEGLTRLSAELGINA